MKIPGLAVVVPGLMASSLANLPSEALTEQAQELKSGPTQAQAEAIRRTPETMNALVDQGNYLDAFALQGRTALMWAVANGDIRIAHRLLELGADVNAVDWWGMSALAVAVNRNDRKMLAMLIEHGADFPV